MKNRIIYLLIPFLFITQMNAQSVGYQGKKFMAELGYSPLTNIASKYFSYALADDHYADGNDPLLFKHVVKVSVEYTLFNSGSFVVRYNPFNYTSNINYYSVNDDLTDLVGVESKGHMISLGYKMYTTATPAPLGTYFGLYFTRYSFSTELVQSEFSRNKVPEELANYQWDQSTTMGISLSYGVKTIFWDKVTMDISLEAGYFLDNTHTNSSFDNELLGGDYQISSSTYPQGNTIKNARAFFFAVPTVAFGYLAF